MLGYIVPLAILRVYQLNYVVSVKIERIVANGECRWTEEETILPSVDVLSQHSIGGSAEIQEELQ